MILCATATRNGYVECDRSKSSHDERCVGRKWVLEFFRWLCDPLCPIYHRTRATEEILHKKNKRRHDVMKRRCHMTFVMEGATGDGKVAREGGRRGSSRERRRTVRIGGWWVDWRISSGGRDERQMARCVCRSGQSGNRVPTGSDKCPEAIFRSSRVNRQALGICVCLEGGEARGGLGERSLGVVGAMGARRETRPPGNAETRD